MIINSKTKISKIINHNPEAIQVIASINPHFSKLKNPLLRKILAPRVTIADASKIGNCSIQEFFDKLSSIGFEIDNSVNDETNNTPINNEFLNFSKINTKETFDVRPLLNQEIDPFEAIMDKLDKLEDDSILEIINSFEPIPLIKILQKRGHEIQVVNTNDAIHTFIRKGKRITDKDNKTFVSEIEDLATLNLILSRWKGTIIEIDVREMEMPKPLLTIMSKIQELSNNEMLFVHHKKIPAILFSELKDKEISIKILKLSETNIKLLFSKWR